MQGSTVDTYTYDINVSKMFTKLGLSHQTCEMFVRILFHTASTRTKRGKPSCGLTLLQCQLWTWHALKKLFKWKAYSKFVTKKSFASWANLSMVFRADSRDSSLLILLLGTHAVQNGWGGIAEFGLFDFYTFFEFWEPNCSKTQKVGWFPPYEWDLDQPTFICKRMFGDFQPFPI